jgi:hypothetical protein
VEPKLFVSAPAFKTFWLWLLLVGSVADPDPFYTDPDPLFHFDTNPDSAPAFQSDLDSDPTV